MNHFKPSHCCVDYQVLYFIANKLIINLLAIVFVGFVVFGNCIFGKS
ncbi:hypothetical protein [Flavobacterium sp.]